jgi:hypothetical protein
MRFMFVFLEVKKSCGEDHRRLLRGAGGYFIRVFQRMRGSKK